MKCAAATFSDVTAFNARAFAPRNRGRTVVGGAVLGLGSVSAVALMGGTATVAAAWMVANSLSGNPNLRTRAPFGLEASLPLAPTRLADPANLFSSSFASLGADYAPAREETLASAAVPLSGPAIGPPAPAQRTAAPEQNVPLPPRRPRAIAQIRPLPQPKPEIAGAAAMAAVAPRWTAEVRYALASVPPREATTTEQPPTARQVSAAAVTPAIRTSPDVTGSIAAAPPVSPAHAAAVPAASPPRTAPQLAYNNPDLPTGMTSHTAIYDIVAHTVYLPDGERLEAHSGLGRMLDDPQSVSARGRGATPPNVYDLTLREGLFHGVQALRLNPVDDARMYGRAGILAHTYMLGPSGQSFGCVSFKDYDEFLRAFKRGEIDRVVVVPHLQSEPWGRPWATRTRRADGRLYAYDIGSAH
jgi:hypothetical protein